MTDPFDDPDRCTQVEDNDPELYAGEPVEFDPDGDDAGDGLPELHDRLAVGDALLPDREG